MLGPWIQKTRMGILRTVVTLGDSLIQLPFITYSKMFFRITNAVSRQQEFAADALAARIVGRQALSDGLKQIHGAAAAFGSFWQHEYVPALQMQVRPPLGSGFSRFISHQQVAAGVECRAHGACRSEDRPLRQPSPVSPYNVAPYSNNYRRRVSAVIRVRLLNY